MTFKRYMLPLAVIMVALLASAQSAKSGHTQWVAESLKAMHSIKPGMTRSDLQKIFATEGGLSTRTQQTYVYRDCPYFKVDVEFQPDESSPKVESPNDQIITISKPYLAWPVSD